MWMLDGWRREQWKHTSAVMWMVAEVNRDSRRPSKPIDFWNPYRKEAGRSGIKLAGNITALKCFLPRG